MAPKRHELYMELGNVGQSKHALWIKVHEDSILILILPQNTRHLVVCPKFEYLKNHTSVFCIADF